MKFGATIEANTFPPWRAYYLQYKALKKLISLIETASEFERARRSGGRGLTREHVAHKLRSPLFDGKWTFLKVAPAKLEAPSPSSALVSKAADFKVTASQLKQYFLRILDGELTKIANFVQFKRAELASECEILARRSSKVRTARGNAGAKESSPQSQETSGTGRARAKLEQVHTVISEFTSNVRGVQRLATFVELNYTGFFKILKKFDKKTARVVLGARDLPPPKSLSPPSSPSSSRAASSLVPFMLRVDRTQLLARAMMTMVTKWSTAHRSISHLRQRQDKVSAEIGAAFKLGRKALRKLGHGRSKDEVNASIKSMQQDDDDGAAVGGIGENRVSESDGAESSDGENSGVLRRSMLALPSTDSSSTGRVLERHKHRVFQSMFNEVVQVLETSDPDTAEGVEMLMLAHKALFSSNLATGDHSSSEDGEQGDGIDFGKGGPTMMTLRRRKLRELSSVAEGPGDDLLGGEGDDQALRHSESNNGDGGTVVEVRGLSLDALSEPGVGTGDAGNDDSSSGATSWSSWSSFSSTGDSVISKGSAASAGSNSSSRMAGGGKRHCCGWYFACCCLRRYCATKSRRRRTRQHFVRSCKYFWCKDIASRIPRPSVLTWGPGAPMPGGYVIRRDLLPDVISGIVIAIFGIPQSLAYAALVGLDPGAGLYAVIVPSLVYPIMGWSRVGAIGPMSVPCLYMGAVADTLLMGNALDDEVLMEQRWALVTGMAFWSGLICCLLSLFRMAELVDFMSEPVLKGFAAASGLLVSLHTLDDLMGVKLQKLPTDDSPWQIIALGNEVKELVLSVRNAVGIVVLTSVCLVAWYVCCKCGASKIQKAMKEETALEEASMTAEAGEKSSEGSGLGPLENYSGGGSVADGSNGQDKEDVRAASDVYGHEGDDHATVENDDASPVKAITPRRSPRTVAILKCLVVFYRIFPPLVILALTGILVGAGLCGFRSADPSLMTLGSGNAASASGNVMNSSQISENTALASGASLPATLYQESAEFLLRCPQKISTLGQNADIEYRPTGSGIGIKEILSDTPPVDFAGSDTMEPVPGLIDAKGNGADAFAEDLAYFPSAATAVAIIANVPLHSSSNGGSGSGGQSRSAATAVDNILPLSLTHETLALIFSGIITKWNDPRIAATNRNFALLLPDRQIVPVVRNDSSGTTAIFVRALSAFAANGGSATSAAFSSNVDVANPLLPVWPDRASSPSSSSAPEFLRATRSAGVIESVISTPNSISYVSAGDAFRAIRASNGGAQSSYIRQVSLSPTESTVGVFPTKESITAAMTAAGASVGDIDSFAALMQDFNTSRFDLLNSAVLSDAKSWPISSFTYMMFRRSASSSRELPRSGNAPPSCVPRRTTALYFIWLLSSPVVEDLSAELDFVLLPKTYRNHLIDALTSKDGLKCPGTDEQALDTISSRVAIESFARLSERNYTLLCPALDDLSDGSNGKSDGSLVCRGMQMVGWLPDLFSGGVVLPDLTSLNVIAPSLPLAFLIMIEHILNANLYAGMIKGKA